jgi:hypothetical protein
MKLLNYSTVEDVAAVAAWGGEILDVQRNGTSHMWQRRGWDTVVFTNKHDCKVILRIHTDTGAVRLKAEPAPSGVDLTPRDPYEIELMPDVPFDVLSALMENLK